MTGFDFNAAFVAPAAIEEDPLYEPTDLPVFTADDSLVDEVNPGSESILTRDQFIKILKEKVCSITFTKVDGTVRTIKGTLRSDLIPGEPEPNSDRAINEHVVPFWDLDTRHWKSFRVDSVLQVIPI